MNILFSFSLLLSQQTFADVAPPKGYIEQCTLARQQTDDTECISCNTYHAEPDACQQKYQAQGYSKKCQSRGASVWDEIWCKPISAEAKEVKAQDSPKDKKKNKTEATPTKNAQPGCSVLSTNSGIWLLLSVFLITLRRD